VVSPRSWLDQRTDVFLAEASAHGLHAPRKAVASLIDAAVSRVALRMRITPRSARQYVSDDDVRALVHDAAESMTAEAPGTQLADLDPTHTVPIALAGRTVAGLAIITELATSAGTDLDRGELINELNQTLSLITEWGTAIEAAATADNPAVEVHEAAIHRTVREFERGRTHLGSGITPLDGGDPDALSDAFAGNITALRAEL
jgi:hypothetical protein